MAQGFPLSPQQRYLWTVDRGDRGYRGFCAVALEGCLDKTKLKTAIDDIVARHEILRTSFRRVSGMKYPLQVVAEKSHPMWEEIALDVADPAERAAVIDRFLDEEGCRVNEQGNGSLLDLTLVNVGPERHLLVARLPAMCADTQSLYNLMDEVDRTLSSANGAAADEPVQYLQFSTWQNELLEDAEEESGREYWQSQGTASWPTLALPFQAQADAATWNPRSVTVACSGDEVREAREAAGAQGADLDVFLLACWQVLLWRLTGRGDVVVRCVQNGRKFAELEGALGLFAKSIPVGTRFEGRLGFRDVLRRVRRSLEEGSDFEEYFSWPEPDEKNRSSGSFGAAFEVSDWPEDRSSGDLRLSLYAQRICVDPFTVKLFCLRRGETLMLDFQYDPEALDREDVESIADQFQTLVRSAAAWPEREVGELDVLSEAQRRRLLVELNDTAVPAPPESGVHERFELHAARDPGATALVSEGVELSYGELNARANRLAHHLRALGVGPEVPVAIALGRCPELIVGLLAVLKAGGAYVPLDVTLPAPRLSSFLRAVRAPVVVTEERWRHLVEGPALEVLLDAEREELSGQSARNPPRIGSARNLAYVIFTSGSTGAPKGIGVEHGHLLNYLDAVTQRLDLPAGGSYAMVSSFGADLGNTVLFPALCGGGALHLLGHESVLDPKAFAAYFSRHGIDVLKIVPSHLASLLTAPRPLEVLPRRLLVLGGEALDWRLVDRIRSLEPTCRVANHYGPTETTVGVTAHPIADDAGRRRLGPTVELGRPMANSRLYALDPRLRPGPAGSAGELHVAGAQLARAYVGQPARTAEKLIPDPFDERPGGRLYKSGDRVRLLAGGHLHFLGRLDHQVKVRGFRFELGEVEAALRRCPGVREAVVSSIREGSDKQRLVAHLVAASVPGSTGELRERLQASLPDYMVPSAFIWLESLPLSPNGKVDRMALPAPDQSSSDWMRSHTAARNPMEEMLVKLAAEVMGVPRLSIHDNFFEMGGDSLQAIQLMSRIRKVFGVDLPVRHLFAEPTVARLAATLGRSTGSSPEYSAIEPLPRDQELPLSFAQKRLWFVQQMKPDSPAYNSPGVVRLDGPLAIAALNGALTEIVRRHEILRTTFPSHEGRPWQVINPPRPVTVPTVDLRHLPEAVRESEARRWISAHVLSPFDLERGPLLRFLLIRLDHDSAMLEMTLHHIVSDGWSSGILIRELVTLYDAISEGLPSPLAELPIQYADFAAWQRRSLPERDLAAHVDYWRRQLGGLPELLELPTDRPRPAAPTFAGEALSVLLPVPLEGELRELSRRQGVTLFMTLLTAFQVLLGRHAESDDVFVGTDIAGRDRVETESLVGFFVNNVVLRTDLSGNPTFNELLGQVRETTLSAFAHSAVPFDLLVKELQAKRSLHQTPLFQVLFVLQNTPVPEVTLPSNLKVSLMGAPYEATKFDLSLFVSETGEGLETSWTYRTELFDRGTIDGMARRFQRLAESIVQDPDAPISRLEMLSPEEIEARERNTNRRKEERIRRLTRNRRPRALIAT